LPPTRAKRGDTWTNSLDGAVMLYIPAGEFTMGGNAYDDEKPQRKVHLDGYWIYKHEVTVAQYRKFSQATGRDMPQAPDRGWKDNYAIVNVSWEDARAYADWAGVALPTEAQWEKAARGTDGREYPWGNEWDASKCANSLSSTKPVGSYAGDLSPYGLHDMAGNVWEWCADWYDSSYYADASKDNPTGPANGTARVLRGGSWDRGVTTDFRCANRGSFDTWPQGRLPRVSVCVVSPGLRLAFALWPLYPLPCRAEGGRAGRKCRRWEGSSSNPRGSG
jgi:formylglycine-generating enzyme required for sulfatase activity